MFIITAFYGRAGEETYVRQIEYALPLTALVNFKNGALEKVAAMKEYWLDFSTPQTSNKKLEQLEKNVQKALSREEYEQLLNHVNNYMHELLELKLQAQEEKSQQNLNSAHVNLIVDVMRNNLQSILQDWMHTNNQAQLNEEQVQKLVLLVQNQLKAAGWQEKNIHLNQQDLDRIQVLIKEHHHKHYNLLVESIDLDALLLRILAAPSLAHFVDARVQQAADNAQFRELRDEIAYMKFTYSDQQSENAELQQSISKLQHAQEELLQRLKTHELATNEKFSSLLAEIEAKLSLLKNETFSLLNKQVKLTLVEILGFKNENLQEADLENWVRNTFVAKDYLEKRLLTLQNNTQILLQAELDRTAAVLMRDISESLKTETLRIVTKHTVSGALNDTRVHEIVAAALKKYDADKTGLADFALESAGGEVLSTRCTESYQVKSAQISVFGIPLWYPSNTPRVAISPQVQPGNCWAFQGFPGYLVLKLNSLIKVTGFTLEHIPKTLAPTGNIQSAPRNFTVWGLEFEKDQDPVLFGEYEYEDNGIALQYFAVQHENIKRPYEIVELRIETNHGNPKYTCLYRFRVHGSPLTA